MKTTIKINSISGILLFEYECEKNSIKKTVEQAVREKINLISADLSYANLSSANLSSANLSCADLRLTNLSYADLRYADLRYADLSYAKDKENAILPIFCKWSVSIIGDKIKIGCKKMTIEYWDSFFESSEEFDTKRNTEEFKQIQAVYLAHKAYLTHLKN